MATKDLDRYQPAIDELRQVAARRRGSYTPFLRQFARRVGEPVEQALEHRGASRIGNQLGHRRYCWFVLHISILHE
jgi:hypothetical protein